MDCSDSLKGGFKLAVLTRVRSLWTLLALVESNAATLEKFSTPMPSLYLHKLTPTQLAPWRRIFIQVLLIFPQFPPPLTTIFYVGAPNIKFFQRPFQLRMKVKSVLLHSGHGFLSLFIRFTHLRQIFCPQGQLMTHGSLRI